jgi:hypothetical protein
MPRISRVAKDKEPVAKKKTPVAKPKKAPVKKKASPRSSAVKRTVKKPVTRKAPAKAAPRRSAPAKKDNRVVVDIIADEEEFVLDGEPTPIFSSWPDLNDHTEVEDIFSHHDIPDNGMRNNPAAAALPAEEEEEEEEEETEETAADDEYDKQKKFFSDWAAKNAPQEEGEPPAVAPTKRPVGLYRHQAWIYLGATIVLLAAVFYLFFSKLTVVISPKGETINDAVTFNVGSATSTKGIAAPSAVDLDTNRNIEGNLQVMEIFAEKTYQTSAEQVTTNQVSGTVTLVNKTAKNQPLVAKTRLLTTDSKLFRLRNTVNIPAGGSISAEIYADSTNADATVSGPTKFTIPGLWAGLQDKIYGESGMALTADVQTKRVIKQSDLDSAKKDINEVLDLKIKNSLNANDSDRVAVYEDDNDVGVANVTYNAKVGQNKADFTAKAVKKVVVATFSRAKAIDLAKARLLMLIPDDKQLSSFDQQHITYSMESYDKTSNTAVVKAYFTGIMSLESDSSLIDRKKLVGLNKQQIAQYLESFPEINDYRLEFSPSFISTAPNLPDRIEIKINDLQ